MAKVKDLIRDSIFLKAEGFDNLKPDVCVVLPTFRRGDNGYFKKSVESILAQSFKNFELIIIDDASVDSTFSQIQTFMNKDSRISVIRHKNNIGLPAISELEAFFRARANRFFYAFDDDEFSPYALEILISYLDNNSTIKLVHGVVTIDGFGALGHKAYTLSSLRERNFIPNPGMLIDKVVLEDVGLYDPHVSLKGACDWDLWIRISQKYVIGAVSENICIEHGASLNDSLGNTYKIDLGLVNEYISTRRDSKLLPKNIMEYEVDNFPDELTSYSKKAVHRVLTTKFYNRFWYKDKKVIEKNEKYAVCINCNYYQYAKTIDCDIKLVYIGYEWLYNIDIIRYILNSIFIVIIEEKIVKKECKNEIKYKRKLIKKIKNVCMLFFIGFLSFDDVVKKINLPSYILSDKTFFQKEIDEYLLQAVYLYLTHGKLKVFRRFIKHLLLPSNKKWKKYSAKTVISYIRLLLAINFKK